MTSRERLQNYRRWVDTVELTVTQLTNTLQTVLRNGATDCSQVLRSISVDTTQVVDSLKALPCLPSCTWSNGMTSSSKKFGLLALS